MAVRTLLQLRTEARQRADMESDDQFVTDAEVDRNINQAIRDLWDLALDCEGQPYTTMVFEPFTAPTISPSTYQPGQAIPYNTRIPYKILSVTAIDGSSPGGRYRLKPITLQQRERLLNLPWGWDTAGYMVRGGFNGLMSVDIFPAPPTNQEIEIIWVPEPFVLTSDSDANSFPNGWDDYVVVDAAIKMLMKEESDTTALQLRKNELIRRIQSASATLDKGHPEVATDIYDDGYRRFGWYGVY